ncbi:restriction endonuclease [Candidatus Pacearchaeota archaeon]|nr:MAG: restriction endonuclease [Candidatus Pacearchaeota archaeon]
MTENISTLRIVILVFEFIFNFWPLILVSAIAQHKRGSLLRGLLILWIFLAMGRFLMFFEQRFVFTSFLIPEPLNTLLFFLTGGAILGLLKFQEYRKQNHLRKKAATLTDGQDLADLSPIEFEEMVVELFNLLGHKAKRTGRSSDHGVDVVVKAQNGEKWIVQCKRWRKPVGENVVRDFYGTLQHEKASQGMIVAANGFSKPAKEWAKGKPISLISGDEFVQMWKKAQALRAKKSQTKHPKIAG